MCACFVRRIADTWVLSVLLCKLFEAGFGPAAVGMGEDRVEDTIGAVFVGEAGHGIGAAERLPERASAGSEGQVGK